MVACEAKGHSPADKRAAHLKQQVKQAAVQARGRSNSKSISWQVEVAALQEYSSAGPIRGSWWCNRLLVVAQGELLLVAWVEHEWSTRGRTK